MTSTEDLPADLSNSYCHSSFEDELEEGGKRCLVASSACFLNESCDRDAEDELLSGLVDNPGTTRGMKLSVLQMILFPSLVNRGF